MKKPLEVERRDPTKIRISISSAIFLFGILLFIVPVMEPPHTVNFGENGIVGQMEHYENISKMRNPVSKAIYLFGDWECHQHASRSFFINGNQMPVCARCAAIFISISITSLILLFFRIKMPLWLIIVLIVPLAVDGSLQLITSYESTNLIRFFTGYLSGFATVVAFNMIIES